MTAQEIVEEITERIEANKAARDEYKAKGEYIEEALRESAIMELRGLKSFIEGWEGMKRPQGELHTPESDKIAEKEQFFREITPEEVERLKKRERI